MSKQVCFVKPAKTKKEGKEILEPLGKYFAIESYGKEQFVFKPNQLDSNGRMPQGSANWEQLLQMIKEQLKLTNTSTFLFVKNDNPDDQLDNDGDLMDVWNELNKNRKAMYYTLKMVGLIYIFLIIK
ncbi:hypothetical protein RFI_02640 [Reticulomyxa filosa]|uniref:PB1 domain-containing protein n=1 Tax=Reticulomyxa filosa TaxID=46433 RepID=X6P9Y4_RETFI|nr:hypothetical protein RFI_02640 [Reticulomyxa filosa]|eukprot:ETO34452.1 hypothetical protein RFI_02640 [Reticulomyxa filosa]